MEAKELSQRVYVQMKKLFICETNSKSNYIKLLKVEVLPLFLLSDVGSDLQRHCGSSDLS